MPLAAVSGSIPPINRRPNDEAQEEREHRFREGRPSTEVHLVPGTGHCSVSKFNEILPMINNWPKPWAKKWMSTDVNNISLSLQAVRSL